MRLNALSCSFLLLDLPAMIRRNIGCIQHERLKPREQIDELKELLLIH